MACLVAFLVYTWALLLIAASEDPPPCVFPFIYKGKSYNTCTSDGSTDKQLWCGTTQNVDRDNRWKLCATKEYGGNSNGQACVFPFIYLGHTYYTCTNKFSHKGRFWCAATGSYDKKKWWSYCADTRLDANYPVGPCVFPFIFEGKTYSGCTADGRPDGKLWCSLARNYDINPAWVYCDPSDPAPCRFPFTYKNKSYTSCTRVGSFDGQLWCATTPSYDKEPKWKACSSQDPNVNPNGPCVFPFIYKGKSYTSCTTDGFFTWKYWCSLTKNFDNHPKWKYCEPTDLPPQNMSQSRI